MKSAALVARRAWRAGQRTAPLTQSEIDSGGRRSDTVPSRWEFAAPFLTTFASSPKRSCEQLIKPLSRSIWAGIRGSRCLCGHIKPLGLDHQVSQQIRDHHTDWREQTRARNRRECDFDFAAFCKVLDKRN